jgi:hypothetical protein
MARVIEDRSTVSSNNATHVVRAKQRPQVHHAKTRILQKRLGNVGINRGLEPRLDITNGRKPKPPMPHSHDTHIEWQKWALLDQYNTLSKAQ